MGTAILHLFGEKRPGRAGRRLSAAVLVLLAVLALTHIPRITAAFGEMGMYLGYRFILRALAVGSLVALCAALLGVILVLKRYSMIGDGLSHVGFGALTCAVALGCVTAEGLPRFLPEGARTALAGLCAAVSESPLVLTLIVVSVCAVLLLRVSQNAALHGDSAIALISTSSLALGVIVTSSVSGMNIDVYNYMFGSILAIGESDVPLSVGLCAAVIAMFVILYPRIFAVTFDEAFFRANGGPARLCNTLIALMTAVTIVLGMRLMGTMLISSLIIFPALTALRLFGSYRKAVICAAIVSVVCFAAGIMLSCVASLPAGAGIVAVNLCAFLLANIIRSLRS